MFGRNKSYTTRALDAEELDTIVQKLAHYGDAWYDTATYSMFDVSVHQFWYQNKDGHLIKGASYRIKFPGHLWKKLNRKISNTETFQELLGEDT